MDRHDSDPSQLMEINNYDVAVFMRALQGIEASVGVVPDDRPAKFRRCGRWLIRESYLQSELGRRWVAWPRGEAQDLPRLSEYGSKKLLVTRLLGDRWEGSSAAQAVFFKSNLRAFYDGAPGVSVKMRGLYRSIENFRTEIETRTAVAASRTVAVPSLLHVDLGAAYPFLCEELVPEQAAGGPRRHQLITEYLLPDMWRLYEHFGISEERLGSFYDLERIAHWLASAPLQSGWDGEGACRSALVRFITANAGLVDAGIPTSLGHGDLSPENMIFAGEDRIFVVDWELSARMPVTWDVNKLLLRVPGTKARIFDLMNRRLEPGVSGRMLPFGQQLVIVAAKRLADTSRKLKNAQHDQGSKAAGRLSRRLKLELAAAAISLDEAGMPVR